MYLVRDITAFVMYCVNGESGSSLLIESTDYDYFEYFVIFIMALTMYILYIIIFIESCNFSRCPAKTSLVSCINIYGGWQVCWYS